MEKEEKGKAKIVQIQYYQSPCGKLILGSFEDKLCMCDWVVSEKRRAAIDKRIQKALNAQYVTENSTPYIRRRNVPCLHGCRR